jgi:hypothetical protein
VAGPRIVNPFGRRPLRKACSRGQSAARRGDLSVRCRLSSSSGRSGAPPNGLSVWTRCSRVGLGSHPPNFSWPQEPQPSPYFGTRPPSKANFGTRQRFSCQLPSRRGRNHRRNHKRNYRTPPTRSRESSTTPGLTVPRAEPPHRPAQQQPAETTCRFAGIRIRRQVRLDSEQSSARQPCFRTGCDRASSPDRVAPVRIGA